jgi:hypothetical protein
LLLKEGNEMMERWFLSKDSFFGSPSSKEEEKANTIQGAISRSSSHHQLLQNDAPSVDRPITTHIIFSTSCSDQQNWESYVFYYHAMKVQQPGHVTRIASGCNGDQMEKLKHFHQTAIQPLSSPQNNFHVHFTPDFSKIRKDQGKYPYKYMNKPFGVRHWMEHVLGMSNHTVKNPLEDDVVILMDPDMILLRPISHDFTNDPHVVWADQNQQPPFTKRVQHGFPMAQQDGYLSNEWMKYNTSYIVRDATFRMVHAEDGPKHYNTGPPYLATVRDMYRIVVLWTDYAPRVFDDHQVLFAEMYGYVLATVQLKLPHTLIKSIVVSTTTAVNREGWSMIDDLPDDQLCHPPDTSRLPIALHYCKRYYAGKWFFSKYRLKKNYISCQAPIMASPPSDIHQFDYWIAPPKDHEPAGLRAATLPVQNHKQVRREAFMLCGLISAINEASTYYKQHHCNTTANWNNSYTVHDSPSDY